MESSIERLQNPNFPLKRNNENEYQISIRIDMAIAGGAFWI